MEAPMAGFLTTHVLDTARGCPAEGLKIALYRVSGNSHRKIAEAVTNADGRTDGPILPEAEFSAPAPMSWCSSPATTCAPRARTAPSRSSSTRCRSASAWRKTDHYHVPLLLSPYGYSTYRGS
jgi:5-hydroxyisourate hydrolase